MSKGYIVRYGVINKLRAKFVNMVSDEKGCKGFVGKDRVFILTGYVSHADISKIESLGIEGMFVNSKGINGIIMEIEGCVCGTLKAKGNNINMKYHALVS